MMRWPPNDNEIYVYGSTISMRNIIEEFCQHYETLYMYIHDIVIA